MQSFNYYEAEDLSDNTISDAGAVWLFRWLMQRQREVRCRAIRLGNNQLTDASLEWLAALIRQQHSAIEESLAFKMLHGVCDRFG